MNLNTHRLLRCSLARSPDDDRACMRLQVAMNCRGVKWLRSLQTALFVVVGLFLFFLLFFCSSSLLHSTATTKSITKMKMLDSTVWHHRRSSKFSLKKSVGYVLVNEYADQMTGASIGLVSLQCWAGAISKNNTKVVEPFVFTESGLGYTFEAWKGPVYRNSNAQSDNTMKLRDLFDLVKWQN